MVIAGSNEARDAFRRFPDEVREEPSILGIAANEAAFREGETWLQDASAYLDGNRRRLQELLKDRFPKVRAVLPEATYLAWLDCRDLGLGDDPGAAFRERGRVALSPGVAFGTGGSGFARFNFGTSRPIVEEAVDRMALAVAG